MAEENLTYKLIEITNKVGNKYYISNDSTVIYGDCEVEEVDPPEIKKDETVIDEDGETIVTRQDPYSGSHIRAKPIESIKATECVDELIKKGKGVKRKEKTNNGNNNSNSSNENNGNNGNAFGKNKDEKTNNGNAFGKDK